MYGHLNHPSLPFVNAYLTLNLSRDCLTCRESFSLPSPISVVPDVDLHIGGHGWRHQLYLGPRAAQVIHFPHIPFWRLDFLPLPVNRSDNVLPLNRQHRGFRARPVFLENWGLGPISDHTFVPLCLVACCRHCAVYRAHAVASYRRCVVKP